MLAYKITKDYKKIYDFINYNVDGTVLFCSTQRHGFLSCYKKSRKIYFAPFNPAFIFEVHSTKLDNLSFIRHCKKDDIEFIEPSI